MRHSTRPQAHTGHPAAQAPLIAIRHHMASTLIGQTVDLLADTKTIAHGVVTGVLSEAGVEKLIVGGVEYDLSQVLTVTPPSVN